MSSDNTLISGVAVRSDSTSLTSKVTSEGGVQRSSEGRLRRVESLVTGASAKARTLTDADSGTLFHVTGTGAGTLTLTLGPSLSVGAYFDFVIAADTGAGDVAIAAGTGRTFEGTTDQNSAVAIIAVSTETVTLDTSALGVGDSLHVCVASSTKVYARGISVGASGITLA